MGVTNFEDYVLVPRLCIALQNYIYAICFFNNTGFLKVINLLHKKGENLLILLNEKEIQQFYGMKQAISNLDKEIISMM